MNATRVCPSNRATEPLSSTFVLQPTMPSRRKEPVRAESPVGSGMSPEALANDKARQPRLLAAAAARKRVSPVAKTIQKAKTGKKVIDLSSLISPTSSASSSSKSGYKEAHAVFTLVKAKFQKGEKKDEYSGAIYFRGKPRYGNNEIFKAKGRRQVAGGDAALERRVQALLGQGVHGGAGADGPRRDAHGVREG